MVLEVWPLSPDWKKKTVCRQLGAGKCLATDSAGGRGWWAEPGL